MGALVYEAMIPINPITKKNSQRIFRGKNGRPFVVPSQRYKNYEHDAGYFLKPLKEPIDYPVELSCKFFRATRHRVDLSNLLEAIQDILVKYKILSDDNHKVIQSVDGSRVIVGDSTPRTEIKITKL